MKRLILLIVVTIGLGLTSFSQTTSPISTAFLTPNPVEGKAELMFDEPVLENLTVVVKDLTGKVVAEFKTDMPGTECKKIDLNLESLRRGIYICQIIGSSGKTKTLRLQKT
ncbi:MAG: T9SS type A sorting domain-containing protein [Flavobacteriales bacterium]|nr:T9SS type A sorting domain-containing protein [Flavobacteriales bacterium]